MTIRKPCHCRAGTPIPAVVFLLLFVVFAAAPAAAQDSAGDKPPAAAADTTETESASQTANLEEICPPHFFIFRYTDEPEECAKVQEAVRLWTLEHPDEVKAIISQLPDHNLLTEQGNYLGAAQVLNCIEIEKYKAAGQDITCSETLVQNTSSALLMLMNHPNNHVRNEQDEDVESDVSLKLVGFGELGECEEAMNAADNWRIKHPEESKIYNDQYEIFEALIEARDYDTVRKMVIEQYEDLLARADRDVSCAETITDVQMNAIKAIDSLFEEMDEELSFNDEEEDIMSEDEDDDEEGQANEN